MTTFKFSFDLNSSAPPIMSSNNNTSTSEEKLTNRHHHRQQQQSSYETVRKTTTNKLPLQILNISDLLSRIKIPPKDWKYDTVPLVHSNHYRNELNKIDPLRRFMNNTNKEKTNPISNNTTTTTSIPETCIQTTTNNIATIVNQEIVEKTDILPGIYEGGLKVWECSIDLCCHLADELSTLDNYDSKHNDLRYVLQQQTDGGRSTTWDIGCGNGFAGCFILRELYKRQQQKQQQDNSVLSKQKTNDLCTKNGLSNNNTNSNVLFSDYNDFVLRDVTLYNIILNTTMSIKNNNYEFLKTFTTFAAGDWMNLSDQFLSDSRFDLLLGADVTYSVSSTKDIVMLLLRHLKIETGIGLIATKRYYFGVGGGTDVLNEAARKERICIKSEGTFKLKIEVIQTYNCGRSNIRDLLRVRCVPE